MELSAYVMGLSEMKYTIIVIMSLLITTACLSDVGSQVVSGGEGGILSESRPNASAVAINPPTVLPPYGLAVQADTATLRLYLSSRQSDSTARIAELQSSIDTLTTMLVDYPTLSLSYNLISQVDSSSSREYSSISYSEFDNSTALTVKLSIPLASNDDTLLKALAEFDRFLNALSLPDTVTIAPLEMKAEIDNPEQYRQPLIDRVYAEVAAVQQQYGDSVSYEITGLHQGLQLIPLSDTEFYLYLDPAIVVREF